MGPSAGFRAVWTPLVGEHAAEVMWKSDLVGSVYGAGTVMFAIACSFGFVVSLPLGVVLASLSVLCFVLRLREQGKIAKALSEYFGTPLSWKDLPSLTPGAFTRACEQHGWSPAPRTAP